MSFRKKNDAFLRMGEGAYQHAKVVSKTLTARELADALRVSISELISKSKVLKMRISASTTLNKNMITVIADAFGYEIRTDLVDDKLVLVRASSVNILGSLVGDSIIDLQPQELTLLIDQGDAPPELIADILSDLSLLYQLQEGGSGITFELKKIGKLKSVAVDE